MKKVADNKTFWKTMKQLLSISIASKDKLTLIENDEIVESNINAAQISNTFFSIFHVDKEQMLKQILSLDSSKAYQDTEIPTKINQEKADIFSNFFFQVFNHLIRTSTFP